jgi:uncharacterized protein
MNERQLIRNPFGVNVFGSSIIRVEPNIVSIDFAVSRLQQRPKEAFQDVRKASQDVRKYLDQAKLGEIHASRVSISQTFRFTAGERKFVGYTARVGYHILLHELDRMDDILSDIVDAGVNEIVGVDFQTTRLKEVRAEARRQAIDAAREKAENYCKAAGVNLGRVIHIEDSNPDVLRGREGHTAAGGLPDAREGGQALDPGSINIRAAVIVAYKIEDQNP